MVDEKSTNYCAIKQVFGLDFMASKILGCQINHKHDINKASFRIRESFRVEF